MSASQDPKMKQLYEFGSFRVDPEKQVLEREGQFVPLQPKTFQILLVLIRHNQQVVTKEDLMKAVWPDTFVEETNLSRNVFMLRKALGENAPEQRYIITVPGQGYRFAEDVRFVPAQQSSLVIAKHEKVEVELAKARPWRSITRAAIAVTTIVLTSVALLAAAVSALRYFRNQSVLTAKDTVVLADFANSTGEPVFDGTLRQGMAVQLEQSPFLSLISDQRIRKTLRLMGKAADAPLTPELARELCARTGSAAVLDGSISKLGTQYALSLHATSCRTGDVLDDELIQASRKEDVLTALSQIATNVRRRVGESVATIQMHDTPLPEATTSSLEALEAYSAGLKVHYSNGAIAALPFFKHAVEIDPQFAMAHSFLGRTYANLDESDLSAQSITRAWQLRDRVSDHERFGIITRYHALVTGNLEQLRQTCGTWTLIYPRDPQPHIGLALYYKSAGQYESAASESRKAIEVDPDFSVGYSGLAEIQLDLGHLADAENTLGQAARGGLETDEFIMEDYDIAFLKGDQSGMQQAAFRARQRSAGENWISARESLALAYSGHLQQAQMFSRRAVEQARQAGQLERAALWEAGAAIREALFGFNTEATKLAIAALALSRDRETEYGAGFALATSGNLYQTRELADDLKRRFPEDTVVQSSYLPVLRARVALAVGDPAKAIELLQPASPYELGTPASAVHALYGALYSVYVRGEAYLAQGKGSEAAAEFLKIIDHRSVVMSDPIYALANLELGRAYALSRDPRDKAKARYCYQNFLTLWNNADADIPVLRRAKREYAKLQ